MKDLNDFERKIQAKENLKKELFLNMWLQSQDWGEGDYGGYDLAYLHGKAVYPKTIGDKS